MSRFVGGYPPDWPDIARGVKDAAGWECVRCSHPHAPTVGRCLTVHHLDGDKANGRWWNLLALCQACHLSIQARVVPAQRYMLPHAPWFRPYVAGYYAWSILGEDLTRDETEGRMVELLCYGQSWLVGTYGEDVALLRDIEWPDPNSNDGDAP